MLAPFRLVFVLIYFETETRGLRINFRIKYSPFLVDLGGGH